MEKVLAKSSELTLKTGEYNVSVSSKSLNVINIKTEVNSNCYIFLDDLSNISELNITILEGSFVKLAMILDKELNDIKINIDVLRQSLSSIIGERTSKETSDAIKHLVCENPEVKGAYDLIVNNYGPDRGIGSIHIEVDDKMTAKDIHPLTRKIAGEVYDKFGIIMTVGIYASNNSDPLINKIRADIQQEVLAHPTIKQIHGFYCDQESKSITFDVIVDFKDKDAPKLIKEIHDDLQAKYPDYNFSIVEDKDFTD